MEISITPKYNEIANDLSIKLAARRRSYRENMQFRQIFDDLPEQACLDFIDFLERQRIISESNMLILPAFHHYFYDTDDLKGVTTLVNLKQLNHLREMREFLRTVCSLLPENGNFVGCFIDNMAQSGFGDNYSNIPSQLQDKIDNYENGIESKIPFINRMYNIIDSRTNRYLTRRSVVATLEEAGLQIVEIKVINGITYFSSRKIKAAA